MINWQPISTAPKDTWILVYAPDEGSEYWECVGVSTSHADDWYSFMEDRIHIYPTHWMPLPDQPTDAIKRTYLVDFPIIGGVKIEVTNLIVTDAPIEAEWMVGKGINTIKQWVFDRGGTLSKLE